MRGEEEMRTRRTNKVLTLSVLCVAVLALAIGFAAFSNTLTISSGASVTPNASTFNVDFSTSSSSVVAGSVTPTKSPTTLTTTSGTIDNSAAPTLTGLSVEFTEPGQSATYNLYAYNAGEYLAYLNGIVFSGDKTCTPGTDTTASYVTSACEGISISVKVGSDAAVTETTTGITNHTLATNTAEAVQVVISYASGSAIADGPFTVELPDISLTYSTTANFEVPVGPSSICTYQGTDDTQKYAYGAEYSCTLADGTPRTFYVLEDGDDTELSKGTTGSAGTGELALIMDRNFTDDTVPSTLAWCIDGGNNNTICQSINSKEEGAPLKHIQDTFGSDVTASFATYEQITSANGGSESNLPQWLYDYLKDTPNPVSGLYGYWLASPHTGLAHHAWYVTYDGDVNSIYVGHGDDDGVRPVITISKDLL